jgi:hypothetical protein
MGPPASDGPKEDMIVKRPKWLWESSATKSDNLKKARKQTDQRMKHQDAQEKRQDEEEKKKRSR